mmetsp:Transcript_47760/g.63094  ORF Transcript_47760/g.63094 Transcript_47760/m.63094 type:complete len:114 (+) Transcript_47760:128-469(+)
MLLTGWVFSALSGAILPTFIWLIGDVFDSYALGNPEETRDTIRQTFYIMIGLCTGIFITATLQATCLAMASSKIVAKIRAAYLQAILQQESAWFDLINYTELSSRINRECQSI